ncbi:hypothetical protein B566_EDAN015272 [Ephemera danica]|nr:hypothetical protein B566_EDAN015272 [Ephemera danica]
MSPRENGLDVAGEEHPRREQFSRARTTERMASFASDSAASNASSGGATTGLSLTNTWTDSSSHHSVESFLESRKLNPERILLNLGFGGSQDSSGDLGLSRIPQRFLQPSQVKGISIADFYRHEMNMAQTFETGFYGYRGLTDGTLQRTTVLATTLDFTDSPSHSTPSPIVAKIMERLKNRGERDYDTHSVVSAPTTTMEEAPASPGVVPSSPGPFSSSPQQRFAAAAQRVQQSRSVLTRIQSWKSMQQDSTGGSSVLNPDNRAFLQNQALSRSPDVPRRKIIMGLRSYTFSGDGDLIECKQDNEKVHNPQKLCSMDSTF